MGEKGLGTRRGLGSHSHPPTWGRTQPALGAQLRVQGLRDPSPCADLVTAKVELICGHGQGS